MSTKFFRGQEVSQEEFFEGIILEEFKERKNDVQAVLDKYSWAHSPELNLQQELKELDVLTMSDEEYYEYLMSKTQNGGDNCA